MSLDMPLVDTRFGQLRGASVAAEVDGFFGLPYATPPIGSLRWCPPTEPAAWSGVRDATQFGADPVQPQGLRVSRAAAQSEDCLYLNVWTPKRKREGGWPVLVWLCGGAFTTGSGAFVEEDPVRLAARGAIVVSVNVRLNVFGFLAHPALTAETPRGASGNYGLMDLAMALRWTRENIAGFGGDPTRITFFGESAGATMGLLLLASPEVDRPYDRAIFQSPGSFGALLALDEAEQHGLGMGEDLAELRDCPTSEIVARASCLPAVSPSLWLARPLRPIVDGWMIRTDDPTGGGAFRPVPSIIGTNVDEGRFFEKRMGIATPDDLHHFAGRVFGDRADAVLDRYRIDHGDNVPALVSAIYGDRGFNFPIDRLVRRFAESGVKTYRYVYDYRHGSLSGPPTHGEEIGVLMDLLPHTVPGDAEMADTMGQLWLSFAERGVPATTDMHWPNYEETRKAHLRLDWPPVAGSNWRAKQISSVETSLIDGRLDRPMKEPSKIGKFTNLAIDIDLP
jgi:para-nitrobenzyl esterase